MTASDLWAEASGDERARLRGRLFLFAVLPLLGELAAARPHLWPAGRKPATVYFGLAPGSDTLGALLHLDDRGIRVAPAGPDEAGQADLAFVFADIAQLNRFFAGQPALPRLRGGLRHPRLLFTVLRLLLALQILKPRRQPPATLAERTLHVRLVLHLIGRALAETGRAGYGDFGQWVAHSPERVFQWSVGGSDPQQTAVYLRLRGGRIQVGRGLCPQREAFVHFAFRNIDAALAMLTSSASQMEGVHGGWLETLGSPEYTRKMALQMQRIDQLLLEG